MRTSNAHFFMAILGLPAYNVLMFPALPSKMDSELEGLRTDVIRLSASLGSGLHPRVAQSISELMLAVNSFYTNAMEGNPSLLGDIEAALAKKFSADQSLRNYQLEHLAHIATQKKMLARLEREKELDICSADFLCWLHREFYSELPEEMHYALTHEGGRVPVLPGELRDRPASVGRHIPPDALDDVRGNLGRFHEAYSLSRLEESMKMPAFAASHHRLLWIHPFRDGNGRVARLFTIAYQYRLNIGSHGLWTVTRAFARNRSEYDRHLALADQPRRYDFDGRGPLSEENLVTFCKYFLRACVDQLQFMESILELHYLERRFKQYLAIQRSQKAMSKQAVTVLEALLFRGEIERGDVQSICKVQRRRATGIINELLDNRLVSSSSAHGSLRLSFTSDVTLHLFPKLV